GRRSGSGDNTDRVQASNARSRPQCVCSGDLPTPIKPRNFNTHTQIRPISAQLPLSPSPKLCFLCPTHKNPSPNTHKNKCPNQNPPATTSSVVTMAALICPATRLPVGATAAPPFASTLLSQ